ncbi:hypothetical protein GQX74_013972 [Glossina fuscipes]|nr:hypothetical protein GQX74_013972 [Glossina fuscipes]
MFSERTTVFVGGDGGDSGNAFLSLSCIEGYVPNNLKNPTTLNQVLVYLGNGNARKEFQVMATVNKLYSDTTGVKRVGGSRLLKVEFCILANILISSIKVSKALIVAFAVFSFFLSKRLGVTNSPTTGFVTRLLDITACYIG